MAAIPSRAGPIVTNSDGRLGQLHDLLRDHDPLGQSALGPVRDPGRTGELYGRAPGRLHPTFVYGIIIQATPKLNVYRVATAAAGIISCCRLQSDSHIPIAPKRAGVLAAGNHVLVLMTPELRYGVILGVLPSAQEDGNLGVGDWLQQGGGTGLKRELAHQFPFTGLFERGGLESFSSGRPLDETSLEQAVTMGGVGWLVDPFQAYLRAGEFAGVFANAFDQHLAVRGFQLEEMSGAHLFQAGDDEGEPYTFYGEAAYAWEAAGRYDRGPLGQLNSDADVQHNKLVAKIDLPAEAADSEPIYRTFRYGGYLGQGGYRGVMTPSRGNGWRRRSEAATDDPDLGLFLETVGRDGSYGLVSAHSVHIGKRLWIAVPRRLRSNADPAGDDAAADNYKAAGVYGTGPDHEVNDLEYQGEHKHLARVATVRDFVVHLLNWKAQAPFHYHGGDFVLPQEQQGPFADAAGPIDYSGVAQGGGAEPPQPRLIRLDPNRDNVEYYPTEAGWTILPDGSVVFRDGYGSAITMAQGRIFIDGPEVHVRSGGTFSVTAEQIVMRAKRSVDISATRNDVRIKAERNLQLLGGNGQRGGVLIEGRGAGRTQLYDRRVGEDVQGAGVVIKATDGLCAVMGQELYLRSTERDVTVDAHRGEGRVFLNGKQISLYSTNNVAFFYGPQGDQNTVESTYYFGKSSFIVQANMEVGGQIASVKDGGLIVRGSIIATGSIACSGTMADRKGWFLGKVPDSFSREVNSAIDLIESAIDTVDSFGEEIYDAAFVQRYYQADQPGDPDTIAAIGFSFRDDNDQRQYGTSNFMTFEPVWQALLRHGAATGANPQSWTENSVRSQDRDTYPWPGRLKWRDEATMISGGDPVTYDPATGLGNDRPYTSTGAGATTIVPDGNFLTIR